MKLVFALAAAGLFGLGLRPAEPVWTVVVGGDSDGHLAPCGCTYPMTGGIRRRATVVRNHASNEHRVVLDTGAFVASTSLQDRFKAEMLAEAAGALGSVVALTPSEAQFGPGEIATLQSLIGDGYVSGNVRGVSGIQSLAERGPFAITAIGNDPDATASALGASPVSNEEALASLAKLKKVGIAMFAGDEPAARELAKRHPELSLIVHRRGGAPSAKPLSENGVTLVSPGERGKHVVLLDRRGGRWENYRVVTLGPEFKDDGLITKMYAAYLKRVDGAGLLDRIPRTAQGAFADNAACLSCHPKAAEAWRSSKHFHAYSTLEAEGHGRDPDCVRCHVTALEVEGGFLSRSQTPEFAFVGCQSCHGAGAEHVKNPKVAISRSGADSCAVCHTGDTSPHFDYQTYWKKIAH